MPGQSAGHPRIFSRAANSIVDGRDKPGHDESGDALTCLVHGAPWSSMSEVTNSTLDSEEVARFARLAGEWWDARGPFKPLHRINPVRLTYIRDQLCKTFARDPKGPSSLSGLSVLDIGCGGGLVSEPLARLGASVTGIDPAPENVEAAKAHAEGAGVKVDYRAATAEEIAAEGLSFDAVLLLEVIEHVPDVPAFLKLVAPLVKPGGVMVLSTLNRTLKAYAFAIIGAELILRWLPLGTHNWDRFVRPDELRAALEGAGLADIDTTGMVYDPLADEWSLSPDTDVNYFAIAVERGHPSPDGEGGRVQGDR
jgi:2-polyprenyl-6-hydroxyphenyl methylase / 3-demethylubiquinone-9 3-methyltransferase